MAVAHQPSRQAAYIHRGGVTFIQIKRLITAPAALAAEPMTTGGTQRRADRRRPRPHRASGRGATYQRDSPTWRP